MNLKDTIETIRYFGVIPILQGVSHRIVKNFGLVKRKLPAVSWENVSWSDLSSISFPQAYEYLKSSSKFFFPIPFESVRKHYAERIQNRDRIVDLASQICEGKLPFFFRYG